MTGIKVLVLILCAWLLYMCGLVLRPQISAVLNFLSLHKSVPEFQKGDKVYWGSENWLQRGVVSKVRRSWSRYFQFEYEVIGSDGDVREFRQIPGPGYRLASKQDYETLGPKSLEWPPTEEELERKNFFESHWGKEAEPQTPQIPPASQGS